MKIKKWQPLKAGDLVDLVAPGWACTGDELQGGVSYLESLGLRVRVSEKIFGTDLMCANSKTERRDQLVKALKAKDSKAVWCVRGGYGAIQLIPDLLKVKTLGPCKPFIGYSDMTTLHQWLQQKHGWATLHGPLLDRLGSTRPRPEERKNIEDILFGRKYSVTFNHLEALNLTAQNKKNIKGVLVGGNLTVLASSIGTKNSFKAKNKIIFFEDTGERAYRLDRMMEQMQQSTALIGVKAIVLGDFLGGEDKDGQNRVWPFWREYAEKNRIPVFKGLKAGHGELQLTVPLGVEAHISQAGMTVPTGALEPGRARK